jgi:hypothetical protein
MEDAFSVAYPPDLRAAEAGAVTLRREKAAMLFAESGQRPEVEPGMLPPDAVGVALSGGGIRSATFCLGVFQALARGGLMRHVDFMSTVSGGGFFGGFLGALLSRPPADGAAEGVCRAEQVLGDPGSRPIGWLRENGRYMAPNGTGDEFLVFAIYIRNLAAVHVVLAATLFLVFGLLGLVRAVAWGAWGQVSGPGPSWADWSAGWTTAHVWWSPYMALPAAVVAFVSFPLGWAYWFVGREKPALRTPSDFIGWMTALAVLIVAFTVALTSVPGSAARVAGGILAAVSAFALLWWQVARWRFGKDRTPREDGADDGDVYLDRERVARTNLSRWLSASLWVAAGLLAVAVVDSLGQTLYAWRFVSRMGDFTAMVGGGGLVTLFAVIRKLGLGFAQGSGERTVSLPRSVVAGLAAVLLAGVLLTAYSVITHAVAWGGAEPPQSPWARGGLAGATMAWRPLALLTTAGLALAIAFGQTLKFINQSSHQALYAARIARAYLGASNPVRVAERMRPPGAAGAGTKSDITEPLPGDDIGWGVYKPHEAGGPLHLVNVTLNETVMGESRIEQRDRKGIPLAVGPCGLSAGVRHHALWSRWSDRVRPLGTMEDGFHVFFGESPVDHPVEALSLGTWTAISGAAFTTGLGRQTTPSLSVLLGLANVRLGYWWDSHVVPGERGDAARRDRLGQWLNVVFPVQTHLFQEYLSRFFGPHRRRWYLSDGGHFENTACYELIRRRLPFIVVCDDGRDRQYTFEDLAGLVRLARIDFGAEIRLLTRDEIDALVDPAIAPSIGTAEDFGLTAPDAPGRLSAACCRAHALLAWVCYDGKAEPETLILFLKPSITGDEPMDVLNYRQQHTGFPQESTIDQYFDEAQWESYRQLGQHIGSLLFREVENPSGWCPRSLALPRPPLGHGLPDAGWRRTAGRRPAGAAAPPVEESPANPVAPLCQAGDATRRMAT